MAEKLLSKFDKWPANNIFMRFRFSNTKMYFAMRFYKTIIFVPFLCLL